MLAWNSIGACSANRSRQLASEFGKKAQGKYHATSRMRHSLSEEATPAYLVFVPSCFLNLFDPQSHPLSRYDKRMKSRLDGATTPQQKMDRFNTALGRILNVSKDQMKEAMAEDERIRRLRKRKPGPKTSSSASAHASDSES